MAKKTGVQKHKRSEDSMAVRSAREAAYETIRSRIITMELKPGDELNDHELAQAIVDGASITLPHGKDRKLNKITKPPSSRARYRIQYFVGTDHISSIVSKSASSFNT